MKFFSVVAALLVMTCDGVRRNAVDFPTIPPISVAEAPRQDLTALYQQALHRIASGHREAWLAARGTLPP